ncbi:hypothetical protein HQ545_04965 [Candidatus Woesearchaeota archaeon]|nr:hypothetical protein [Candidatus Woesearchaeota archaeon]
MLTYKYMMQALRLRLSYDGPDEPVPRDHLPHSHYVERRRRDSAMKQQRTECESLDDKISSDPAKES